MEDAVKKLLEQAVDAKDSADAMRFAQAACNAANAIAALSDAKRRSATALDG
jgi:hypothetical protein